MNPTLRRRAPGGRFSWLLVSLLLLLIAGAFLSGSRSGLALNNVLLGLVLVTSIYPVSQTKSFVWIGGIFATVTFVAMSAAHFTDSVAVQALGVGAGFVFFLHAAAVVLLNVLLKDRISVDELAGAVSAYLLIGISGAFVFAFIDLLGPGSIVTIDSAIPEIPGHLLIRPFGEYLYFSFTCLTTLGFGDLVPVSAEARVFAYLEAVIGQVYLTVLVARLVGMHLTSTRTGPH